MQIYFSPECIKEDAQILNIVTDKNDPVGYLSFLITEKKMYVYGHVHEEGVSEDFKDLIKPYLAGLTSLNNKLEVFSYFNVGGKMIDINEEQKNNS